MKVRSGQVSISEDGTVTRSPVILREVPDDYFSGLVREARAAPKMPTFKDANGVECYVITVPRSAAEAMTRRRG